MKTKDMKIRVKIIRLGYFPFNINLKKIENWKSSLFKVTGDISLQESIKTIKDNEYYEDEFLSQLVFEIKKTFTDDYNFVFIISNLKLKDKWFSRILTDNVVILSYKPILKMLQSANIPEENIVLMLLYTYSLLYKKNGKIPDIDEEEAFMHGDTRGCIFDLTTDAHEVIYSCVYPIICKECIMNLSSIDSELIEKIRKKELPKIERNLSFSIMNSIKNRPIISATFAIFLPVSISLLTSLYLQSLPIILCWLIILIPIFLLIYLYINTLISKKKR